MGRRWMSFDFVVVKAYCHRVDASTSADVDVVHGTSAGATPVVVEVEVSCSWLCWPSPSPYSSVVLVLVDASSSSRCGICYERLVTVSQVVVVAMPVVSCPRGRDRAIDTGRGNGGRIVNIRTCSNNLG